MAKLQKGKRKARREAKPETPKPSPAATVRATSLRERVISIGLCGVLVLATYLAYSNSFDGQFVFDDSKWILAMSEDRDKNRDIFEVMTNSRRPIVEATLYWDYRRADKIKATRAMVVDEFAEPEPYHWTNLFIHIVAGLALFGVVRRTLRLGPFPEAVQKQAHFIAFAGALLWLVHPLNTQAVTYLIQRAESLMGMFYLLTLYFFTHVITSRTLAGRVLAAALAIFCCGLGMGSKAVMVTAPFVVLLYDFIFASGSAGAETTASSGDKSIFSIEEIKRRFITIGEKRGSVHVLLLCTLSVLFYVGVAQGVLAPKKNQVGTVGFSLNRINRTDRVSPGEYLTTQFGVITHYLKLSIVPVGQALDYRWRILNFDGDDYWLKQPASLTNAVLPALFIGAVALAVLYALVRRPWLGFMGAWFFIILSPTSSFVPIRDPLYEHRMYLSLAGVLMAVVVLLWRLIGRIEGKLPKGIQRGPVLALAIIPLAIILGTLSHQRNALYANPSRLWEDNVVHRPLNDRALNNFGKCLLDTIEDELQKKLGLKTLTLEEKLTNLDRAIDALKKATEIRPTFVNAWFNLGNGYSKRAKIDEEIERRKLGENTMTARLPDDVMSRILKGFDDAAHAYEQAIKYREGKASHWVMLGNAYTDAGEALRSQNEPARTAELFEKSRDVFLAGEQKSYKNTSPVLRSRLRFNLGNSHYRLVSFQRSTYEKAIEWYEKAIEVNPKHPFAWIQIGNSYFELRDHEKAIDAYRRGLEGKPYAPTYNLAHVRIAICLRNLGRFTQARDQLTSFLKRVPDDALAQQQLKITNRLIEQNAQPTRSRD